MDQSTGSKNFKGFWMPAFASTTVERLSSFIATFRGRTLESHRAGEARS
jgi:hypothetical protein